MNTWKICFGAGILMTLGITACTKHEGGVDAAERNKIVYVLSNDYHDNSNSVLAYKRKPDGRLVALAGSPFPTGGAGLGNPMEALGPDDTDDAIVISQDGRLLLTVNGGSNTIAVFFIHDDGSLTPVPGSPFPSGGQTPCSIAINGNIVYIANKSLDPLHTITQLPNYVSFKIDGQGHLDQVPGSRIEVPAGSSPSQVLLSNDHMHLFGTDFLAFTLPSEEPIGTLVALNLGIEGSFQWAPSSPLALPAGDGGALGLAIHPYQPVLYVGLPVISSVGVFGVATSGALTLTGIVSGGPASCWLRTNAEGSRLYVLNAGENSVGVFDLSNPTAPVSMGKLVLKNTVTVSDGKGGTKLTSGDFALNFSPDGKILYVVSQDTDPSAGGDYNYLHSLWVAGDGTLTEPGDPLALPVAADIRPMGVVTR